MVFTVMAFLMCAVYVGFAAWLWQAGARRFWNIAPPVFMAACGLTLGLANMTFRIVP